MIYSVAFPLSHDPTARVVRVGPVTFNKPNLLSSRSETFFQVKAEVCGEPDGSGLKDAHTFYCQRLGPKFNRRFHAAQYYTWIEPHMTTRVANMLRHEGRHYRIYSNDLVERAHAVLPYIREAENDGLLQLIPTIILFGASPQKVRRQVGKGSWRRFANLSVTRAKLIMHAGLRIRQPENITHLLDVPSGCLPYLVNGDEIDFIAARLAPKKRLREFMHTHHLVNDTRRMLRNDFNPHWSLRRMIEEHERGTREANRRHYSDERFAPDWQFARDGLTATLLTSRLDIASEGAAQRHCVASYAKRAARGNYAVFRIEGSERATLGLRRTNEGWIADQCYTACNGGVSREVDAFARRVAGAWGQHQVGGRIAA